MLTWTRLDRWRAEGSFTGASEVLVVAKLSDEAAMLMLLMLMLAKLAFLIPQEVELARRNLVTLLQLLSLVRRPRASISRSLHIHVYKRMGAGSMDDGLLVQFLRALATMTMFIV